MRMFDLIEKKKQNLVLTDAEIQYIIDGYMSGEIEDYQMSAFLMACWFHKLTREECFALMRAMATSGDMMDLREVAGLKADKHSTGGVGDKITLILLPIMASLGIKMAKSSGKGLGYTGGTIDKLQSIGGLEVQLSRQQFIDILSEAGMVISSQSANIAPADKKIYALRDVTALVDDGALIASSIMSKKLASGADIIVLDVKCGNGAFMKEFDAAKSLAQLMVQIGKDAKKQTVAVITDMNIPLGRAVGNAIEIKEALSCLKGNMPSDIKEVVFILGIQILLMARKAENANEAAKMMTEEIESLRAYNRFCTFVAMQGGDVSQLEDTSRLPNSAIKKHIFAQESGYVSACDCGMVGKAALATGAGREKKESDIDYGAGIYLEKTYGDAVQKGQLLAVVYASTEAKAEEAATLLQKSFRISKQEPPKRKMIKEILN